MASQLHSFPHPARARTRTGKKKGEKVVVMGGILWGKEASGYPSCADKLEVKPESVY